jgi:peptidoglycan hydrolase FlgJ
MTMPTQFFSMTPAVSPLAAASRSKVTQANPTREANAAKELEATFLSLLLKEMRQTLESEGLFPGDTGDVQGGLFDLYLGQHLADAGGVGLATALERLQQNNHAPDRGSVPLRGTVAQTSRS